MCMIMEDLTNKEILLTINLEGGHIREYDELEKRYVLVPKIINGSWRITTTAVEYYASFESRPNRMENKRMWSEWLKMKPMDRLRYHMSVLADERNAVGFTFNVVG